MRGRQRRLQRGPGVKSAYGRLMRRSQARTKCGTGKNSANGILPRVGLAAIYGKPAASRASLPHISASLRRKNGHGLAGEFKVRRALHSGRGCGGLRKRKAGYVKAYPELPPDVPFSLISAAPNLGADPGDLPALIAAIENAGVSPGLIVLDTLAQTLGPPTRTAWG